MKKVKYIGLDVHLAFIEIAIADEGRKGEVRSYGRIPYDLSEMDKFIRKMISQGAELKCVYEAGPCGYSLYRHLTGNGIDCKVIAPSQIPKKSGDRIKNDRRDAKQLARLHRSGELTSVYVPDEEDEALRDLTRAREDAVAAFRVAKQQLGAFLLRHNKIYPGKTKWSKMHFRWLAKITMPHPEQQFVLQEYINTVEISEQKIKRFTEEIKRQAQESRLAPHFFAFQSLRGVSTLVAATMIAEIGDLNRFDHPEKLMAYLGLVPSEYSSGGKEKRGQITKTGNGHARKSLIEGSQAYRLPARKTQAIRKRQEGLPEEIQNIAWKAQVRLCGKHRRLIGKGKKHNIVTTAIARELVGFIWAIAQKLPLAA